MPKDKECQNRLVIAELFWKKRELFSRAAQETTQKLTRKNAEAAANLNKLEAYLEDEAVQIELERNLKILEMHRKRTGKV